MSSTSKPAYTFREYASLHSDTDKVNKYKNLRTFFFSQTKKESHLVKRTTIFFKRTSNFGQHICLAGIWVDVQVWFVCMCNFFENVCNTVQNSSILYTQIQTAHLKDFDNQEAHKPFEHQRRTWVCSLKVFVCLRKDGSPPPFSLSTW